MAIPHLFICPITLDLFTDPVTLCTGQTYDRSGIEKWLASGNLTCPVTMQRLHDPSIVPNHTLRHLIDQWRRFGPHFYADQLNIDPHPAAMAALKHDLDSHESSLETKLQVLEKIQALIGECPPRRLCLAQSGFLRVLLELLFGEAVGNLSSKFAELAVSCAVQLMSFGEMGSLNMLLEESKLQAFVDLFESGTENVKVGLCHIVEAVSSSLETRELCALLGQTRGILQGLIHLIRQNSDVAEIGLKAIAALCSSLETNRKNLVREGVVDGLITYISNTLGREKGSAPLAVAEIERLLALEAAKQALVNNPYGIKVLVKMVFRVSDHEGSESAVNSLTTVCCGQSRVCEKAVSNGILTQLLFLLQCQCSGRTKSKARALLKLLRSLRAKDENHGYVETDL